MKTIIKLVTLKINNLKNIEDGELKKLSDFSNIDKSSVIGIYGQNGSGKTTLVESLQILKKLLLCRKLPSSSKKLIMFGEKKTNLEYEFIIKNPLGEYYVRYRVSLEESNDQLIISQESLDYRENIKSKRYKKLISVSPESVYYRKNFVDDLEDEKDRIKTLALRIDESKIGTSFIFQKDVIAILSKYINETESILINNICTDFNRDFHIIDDTSTGLILANLMMPFSISNYSAKGNLPYDLHSPMVFPRDVYESFSGVIKQINIVLCKIIPNLKILIKELGYETMNSGKEGVRFELLSEKEGVNLPLRCESAGTLKLISILSILIAVFNNPNALVVIDELDSGVFEFLLGEILSIISEFGKGQLFFTSHNLRVLEVLNKKNLWFTTVARDKRFIQLKYITKNSNMRDIYIRAIQLGGQDEDLYNETDKYFVEKAFRMGGIKSEEA
jgi:AAA15 family ATPase/GTPase